MNMISYPIDKNYKSVYIYLKQHAFSEHYITNLRKTWGNIVVNDHIVNIRKPLNKGDILQINDNPYTKSSIMRCILGLDVVYEDDFYLIVNKPAGLATTPTRSHYTQNLAGAICNYMDSKSDDFVLRVVNRLDKDTAGIVIVAKSSIAQKELKDIKKTYYALCIGKIDKNLTIDKPIATLLNEFNYNQMKRVVSPDGKEAITYVEPIKYIEKIDCTLIKLNLVHGRTHQIRVHLSSIGHALLGDEIYGQKSDLITHTALVCKEISFVHPFTNKPIDLQIDFPEDIKNILTN